MLSALVTTESSARRTSSARDLGRRRAAGQRDHVAVRDAVERGPRDPLLLLARVRAAVAHGQLVHRAVRHRAAVRALEQALVVERAQVAPDGRLAHAAARARGRRRRRCRTRRAVRGSRPKRSALRTRVVTPRPMRERLGLRAVRLAGGAAERAGRQRAAGAAERERLARARRRRARRRGSRRRRRRPAPVASTTVDRRRRRAHDLPAANPTAPAAPSLTRARAAPRRTATAPPARRPGRRRGVRPRRQSRTASGALGRSTSHRRRAAPPRCPPLLGVPSRVERDASRRSRARASTKLRQAVAQRAAARNGDATCTWRGLRAAARPAPRRVERRQRAAGGQDRPVVVARQGDRDAGRLRPDLHGARCRRRAPSSTARVKRPSASSPTHAAIADAQPEPRGAAGHDRARAAEHERRLVDDLLALSERADDVAAAHDQVGIRVPDDEQVHRQSRAPGGQRVAVRGDQLVAHRVDRVEVERRGRVGVEHRRVVDVVARGPRARRGPSARPR